MTQRISENVLYVKLGGYTELYADGNGKQLSLDPIFVIQKMEILHGVHDAP